MTGFGRTGALFACEQADVAPDIMCLSKGLTGGAIPLAVTMCRGDIFEAHYAPDRSRMFFHSSSFTANPIACAAALANLDVWEKTDARARVAKLCALQEERITRFADNPRFRHPRRIGTIAAVDFNLPRADYLATTGLELMRFFNERGLLLRPLGETIYVLPPYCVTGAELDRAYEVIAEAGEKFAQPATVV
jgi:adenosylmethionine-8-amino-7-oxononanoate aminotransferase